MLLEKLTDYVTVRSIQVMGLLPLNALQERQIQYFQTMVQRTSFGCMKIRLLGICLSSPISVCLWLDRNLYCKRKFSLGRYDCPLGLENNKMKETNKFRKDLRGSNIWEEVTEEDESALPCIHSVWKRTSQGEKEQISTQIKVLYILYYCRLCCDHTYTSINVWLHLLTQSGTR